MIILDASALIALLDADDAHHATVVPVLDAAADRPWHISALTLAEVMTRAAADPDLLAELGETVADLSIQVVALEDADVEALAQLRARTRLRMPDCCVVLAAQQLQAQVVTADMALAERAAALGISVAPEPAPA